MRARVSLMIIVILTAIAAGAVVFYPGPLRETYTDPQDYFSFAYPKWFKIDATSVPIILSGPLATSVEIFYTASDLSPTDYYNSQKPPADSVVQTVSIADRPVVVENGSYNNSAYTSYYFRHPESHIVFILTHPTSSMVARLSVPTILSTFKAL